VQILEKYGKVTLLGVTPYNAPIVLVLLTNPTNTLVLQTKRKSGKCDSLCCLFAFPWLIVEQKLYHQYIGGAAPIPPLVMGYCHVSSTNPNRQINDQLLCWSERKRKQNYCKMAAKQKEKKTSITMVQDQYLSSATIPTPSVSHWSLPLSFNAGTHLLSYSASMELLA
jgi:hypothetical protein